MPNTSRTSTTSGCRCSGWTPWWDADEARAPPPAPPLRRPPEEQETPRARGGGGWVSREALRLQQEPVCVVGEATVAAAPGAPGPHALGDPARRPGVGP